MKKGAHLRMMTKSHLWRGSCILAKNLGSRGSRSRSPEASSTSAPACGSMVPCTAVSCT